MIDGRVRSPTPTGLVPAAVAGIATSTGAPARPATNRARASRRSPERRVAFPLTAPLGAPDGLGLVSTGPVCAHGDRGSPPELVQPAPAVQRVARARRPRQQPQPPGDVP